MKSITNFLQLNKTPINIAVVGDSLIDEYYDVKITRISPEFPTQIMHSNDWHPTTVVPGGAANVCLQISNGFNVKCFLLSLIDNRTVSVFKKQPFNAEYCVILNEKETHMPLKRRFYDGDYPLPRWDIEASNYGFTVEKLKTFQIMLLNNLHCLLENKQIDIVVLSDYGKGLFNNNNFAEMVIDLCKMYNISTIVDPKNPPVDRWTGCTYFKPNAFEACKMTGLSHGNWQEHQNYLNNKYGINNVIITDGPNTPFVFLPEREIKLARQPNKQSVIGAGDCFCAFLAMGLAHKMLLTDAVEVAWNASSLYIESKHNKPIMPHEFAKWNNPIHSKIISVEEMKKIMDYDKSTWIWTNGCFDVAIHAGHLKTLEAAKQLGDKVIVGINTDESVKRLKGSSRPILNWQQRAENLAYLQYVDFIIPIDEDTPKEIIKYLKPSVIVKGEEYKDKYVAGSEYIDQWGGKIHFVAMVPNISTTNNIKILNGEI